jgi:nicotinamidase-related amidase
LRIADTFISNPQLANDLKSEGIGHIVVFGIQSEYCVKSTCEGALAAGFRVSLLQGAHSTYDVASRKAEEIETEVEETLRKAGVEIVPWRSWHAGVEKELK